MKRLVFVLFLLQFATLATAQTSLSTPETPSETYTLTGPTAQQLRIAAKLAEQNRPCLDPTISEKVNGLRDDGLDDLTMLNKYLFRSEVVQIWHCKLSAGPGWTEADELVQVQMRGILYNRILLFAAWLPDGQRLPEL